jgi:hypothetical protein
MEIFVLIDSKLSIISWYIFEILFYYFISYLYMRVLKLTLGNFFLYISLCFLAFSVKRPDGHILASERTWLCRSLIWQHAVRMSMYHIRTQAFCFLCQTQTLLFACSIMLCYVCFLSD